MARTSEGATLTEQHRRAQLRVRSKALRDYTRLWAIWQPGEPGTTATLIAATLPLVRAYHGASATLAAGYYEAFRATEGAGGVATPRLAPVVADGELVAALYATTRLTARERAMLDGPQAGGVKEALFTRTAGAVTRLVFRGGRDTIVGSVVADKQALGWFRVTDGDPCAFCALLAGRGPVFKTEQSASFEAHDHCGCTAMPLWPGTKLPAATQRYRDIYERAQDAGLESGLLQHGENSSAARLKAVRQYLATT